MNYVSKTQNGNKNKCFFCSHFDGEKNGMLCKNVNATHRNMVYFKQKNCLKRSYQLKMVLGMTQKIVAKILHFVFHVRWCCRDEVSRFFLALSVNSAANIFSFFHSMLIWHYTYLYRIWILITFGLRQHVPDFGNKFFYFSSLCGEDMTTILEQASDIYVHTAS